MSRTAKQAEKMTEMTGTEEEVEALDREAREALDRLADKREELGRQHRGTELAEQRRREREEERRREEEREAAERGERRRREELERLGEGRLALEERAEEEARALIATLEELKGHDAEHRMALASGPGGFTVHDMPPDFGRELNAWFAGRFGGIGGVIPTAGHDFRGRATLPERDPLTPKRAPARPPGRPARGRTSE